LIITHATDFGHFTFGGKTNRAEGSFCPTKSDDDFVPSYETRSVSEDIQVLQMHRGSLSSINREQIKLDLRLQPPAMFKMDPMAATRDRAVTGISSYKEIFGITISKITIGLIFLPLREPVHISIDY